jgi:GTPase
VGFVDEGTVRVKAGRGGDGSASLASEPFKPRGGPDGGNGGDGGSVVFEVSSGVHDLSWLAEHPQQRAAAGEPGRSNNRDGARGKELVIPVPDGTVVHDEEGLLADLVGEGSRVVVAQGGRGGRGNAALAGPRRRLPRTAEQGEPGEERRLRIELRTVADVGLVGLPNAGKSTLLARISAAKPKIADYPFTTLTPNLGIAEVGNDRFVVADVPGLIEGASEGRGLGHRFLRHVSRCRVVVIVVDLASEDPASDLAVVRRELESYDPELARRARIVVGTKADLADESAAAAVALGGIAVSGVTGEGLDELLDRVSRLVERAVAEEPDRKSHVVLRPGRPSFTVTREDDGGFVVSGRTVEHAVRGADLESDRQVAELQRRLRRLGVFRRLASMGASTGDEVRIAGQAFEYVPDEAGSEGGGA